MTAPAALASWHHDYPGKLAGSLYAVAPGQRIATARAMAEAGLDIHLDVMAAAEGLPAGVSPTELAGITETVGPAVADVHLIGSPDFVDATLPGVLAHRPGKVFLPWAAFTDHRAAQIRDAGSAAWITLWQEWNGITTPHWPAAVDGVLVMLIEPGTRGRCRLDRLAIVAACAAELPVIVDGGVTEDIAPLCLTAGVASMVVGRALLPSSGKEAT
ncbi:ribulose phosphate epimerase [Mycobacterium sp. PS03-16]|uniref:ribulose phosphate epimerase n=1 Tax=Mycobacterium sp. PS03-16 TaxID=2559611 RepID=UPI001074478C|nr:ribulose phosphate epimerase [Mycobacterium sp. PS03-16]TFV58019.1 ribulose phosphate epimerase [Mycobacterium sp. PS03-16]